jgi:hypothetical protein
MRRCMKECHSKEKLLLTGLENCNRKNALKEGLMSRTIGVVVSSRIVAGLIEDHKLVGR